MRFALILVAVALVAGCGEDDEVPSGGPAPGPALAALKITVDGKSTTVACDTAGESRECGVVDAVDPAVFEPTPGNVACTQQYGGPEKATVTGTLRGEEVDASFSRENGCEIARWQDAQELLDLAG
jgi:hypothetical protein